MRMHLGERLKHIRESAGYKQSEAAKILDIPESAVSKLEAGKRKVSAREVAMLAALYHAPVNELLAGLEDQVEEKQPLSVSPSYLIVEALHAEGASHKQWYLWQLAKSLGMDLSRIDADPGIAP